MNLLSKYAQVHADPSKTLGESETAAAKTAFISAAKLKAAITHVLAALNTSQIASEKLFVIFSTVCVVQVSVSTVKYGTPVHLQPSSS